MQSNPIIFISTSANDLWRQAACHFANGFEINAQESRSGSTKEALHVNFILTNPKERLIWLRKPAINPAFAIAEFAWIFGGRKDSKFLNYWNSKLPDYAGKGKTYNGAYGYRMRKHFNCDQIDSVYETLKNNPQSRQVILQIWDPQTDLPIIEGKPRDTDIPCNVMSMLKVRDRKLWWTQIVRSNDLFRGVPYNIFQFTLLHELMASWLNVKLGSYYQFCDSLHVYDTDMDSINNSHRVADIQYIIYNDEIKLSKEDTEMYFFELAERIVELSDNSKGSEMILSLSKWENAPLFLQNFLRIMAAENLRRRRNMDLSKKIMDSCTNPALNMAWSNWCNRFVKKES